MWWKWCEQFVFNGKSAKACAKESLNFARWNIGTTWTMLTGPFLLLHIKEIDIFFVDIANASFSPSSFILSFSVSHLSFCCFIYALRNHTQLVIQALVIHSLDHCNAHEVGLPLCAVKVLQMAHNAAAHLVFNQLKRAHVTLLLIDLHWLSMTAPNQIQVTNAAFGMTSRSVPIYLNWNVQEAVCTSATGFVLFGNAIPAHKAFSYQMVLLCSSPTMGK